MNQKNNTPTLLLDFIRRIKEYQEELVLGLVMALIALISFQLGKYSQAGLARTSSSTVITQNDPGEDIFLPSFSNLPSGESLTKISSPRNSWTVVASKNSDKYHFLWCPGAGKIAEKNKLTFPSEAEAQQAGYSLAGNCKK